MQIGSAYDNVEWFDFTAYFGYDAYQFKVINFVTNGNYVSTKVSMDWW